MIYELTPDAIELGLAAALPPVFELRCSIAEFGRGERNCTVMSDAVAVVRFVRQSNAATRVRIA